MDRALTLWVDRRYQCVLAGLMLVLGVQLAALGASADVLGVTPTALGWINFVVFYALSASTIVGAALGRRRCYEVFGQQEPVPIPSIGLWRRILLLTSSFAALIGVLVAHAPNGAIMQLPSGVSGLAILASAYIASFGWMYTTFHNERAERTANTLATIRDLTYAARPAETHDALVQLLGSYRSSHGIPRTAVLPCEALETPVDELLSTDRASAIPARTFGEIVDDALNILDQAALGVREGQLDFSTVDLTLRSRYVRQAYVFADYIAAQTRVEHLVEGKVHSEMQGTRPRRRARDRTWEHFLWLTAKFETVPDDGIQDVTALIAPPFRYGPLAPDTNT